MCIRDRPSYIDKNFTEIGREGTQLNPFWLVKSTDDNKLVTTKLTVETVEVGGISVSCPTFTNIKDIAVNDVLYVKSPKRGVAPYKPLCWAVGFRLVLYLFDGMHLGSD